MKKDKTVEKENYTKTKVKLFLNAFCEERSLTCASFAYYYIPLLMATGNYLDPKTEIDYVKEKESMVVGNQRLIRLFNELTPWEKANVFFELAPLLHTELLDIAKALTAKAREADAMQRVVEDE